MTDGHHHVADVDTLTIDTITRISRQIAADYDPRLHVIGVASTDGESGRVELLVTIRGCHEEPCVIMLNVTRLGRESFERDFGRNSATRSRRTLPERNGGVAPRSPLLSTVADDGDAAPASRVVTAGCGGPVGCRAGRRFAPRQRCSRPRRLR